MRRIGYTYRTMKYFTKLTFLILALYALFMPTIPAQEVTPPRLEIENLSLPENLGKIEDRFQGDSDYWIIQIQDVHAHLTAQENISAIIDHLSAVYGVDTIALEGGWDKTRFVESWGLPSSREKQMLARSLLEDEYITGPAYAALFSSAPIDLIGIENPQLYHANLKTYLKHIDGKEEIYPILKQERDRLTALKKASFNEKLETFDAVLFALREKHDIKTFIPAFLNLRDEFSVATEDLSSLALFLEIYEKENTLDKDRLKSESDRLLKEFKYKRLSFEELLQSHLIDNEKIQHYPASKVYLEILNLRKKLSTREFFNELQKANERILEKLYQNENEKNLMQEWELFLLAEKIIQLQATPDLLKIHFSNADKIQTLMTNIGLKEALELALEFYDGAFTRDFIFFKSISEKSELQNKTIAMVTGGFHTEGLSDHFKKAGISYITISPNLAGESPDMELYYKRLKDTPLKETLSAIQNRFLTPDFDLGFVAGVLELKQSRNVLTARDVVLQHHETNAATSSEKIKPLTWQDWSALSREEQLGKLGELLKKQPAQGEAKMLLVARARDLADLFETPEGRMLWEKVRNEKSNVLALLYDNVSEIPEETIGGQYHVIQIQGDDLLAIVHGARFRSKFLQPLNKRHIAAMLGDSEGELDERILRLPNNSAISFLFRTYLSNPEMSELVKNDLFLRNLDELFMSVKDLNRFLASA